MLSRPAQSVRRIMLFRLFVRCWAGLGLEPDAAPMVEE